MSSPFSSSEPLSYTGINLYTQPQFISANRPPTVNDVQLPGTQWQDLSSPAKSIWETTGAGVWSLGNNAAATTTTPGIVELSTLAELQGGTAPAGAVPTANDVATVIAGVVAGAVPPANESQAGIAEIATQLETDTGLDDTKIVSPLKLATYVASGAGAGSFTDLTATGTVSFTGATGGLTMTSATASSLGVTGAGIDLTLDSAAGQLILTGGEAAVNAVRIQADNAAGGIDADAGTGGITIDTTGAVSIDSAAASNFTVTGATFDLTLASVGGSVKINSDENTAGAIALTANGGTSETITITASQGTGAASIGLSSTSGGVTIAGGLAANDAINLVAASGGVDVDAALQINFRSTQNAADSIVIESTLGGIDILASGATGASSEDIDIIATGSSVNVTSTENAAEAIYLRANGGTSETIRLHSDQGIGVASINIGSDVGGITIAGGLGTADAVNITASTAGGGIDIDSSTGGFDVLTTGGISLDASLASNLTVTGAAVDLTIASVGGSVNISGSEADAAAINIDAASGGIDVDAALQVNIASSQDAADAIRIVASAGGIDIDAVGEANQDITITNTGGSLVMSTTEADAAAITLTATNGGMDLTTTGASLDIDLLATGGSINVTATEAAATAIVLNASNAAGGIDISTGGGSVDISSAGFVTVVNNTASVASPTASSTQNVNVGAATFTGFTTASAGSQVFTITNSIVTTSSVIHCTVCNEGANDAQMTITRIQRAAGSFAVTCTNNGAAALNGNVTVSWWILQA